MNIRAASSIALLAAAALLDGCSMLPTIKPIQPWVIAPHTSIGSGGLHIISEPPNVSGIAHEREADAVLPGARDERVKILQPLLVMFAEIRIPRKWGKFVEHRLQPDAAHSGRG